MCKSKDAVIVSYHWTVLHTPVDTRAMYFVSSLLPLFVSRTFRYGRGERQDCEKKDCKGDCVGVFQWLARLARLACTFGSLARTLATLFHWCLYNKFLLSCQKTWSRSVSVMVKNQTPNMTSNIAFTQCLGRTLKKKYLFGGLLKSLESNPRQASVTSRRTFCIALQLSNF